MFLLSLVAAVVLGTLIFVFAVIKPPDSAVPHPLAPLEEEYLQLVRINDVVGMALDAEIIDNDQLGDSAFRPSEFSTTLNQAFTEGHAGTTLKVSSITTKDDNTLDGNTLGDTIVLHINPNRSNAEIVICTGLTTATKTFTGCTFGYRFDQDTTDADNIKQHAPGEVVIISNDDHYLTRQFAALDGTNTFAGMFAIATSSEDIVQFFFLPSPTSTVRTTYLWYNRTSGLLGFKTATSGELAFNSDGTSFTPITPFSLIGGELKIATSTYDFVLRDSTLLGIATSTLSNGTASGKRLDDYWNVRWNASTTHPGPFTIGGHATTTGRLVIGTTGPTWPSLPGTGLWISGNATSTGSISAAKFCISGTNCTTKLSRVATSTVDSSATTAATSATSMKTITFTAGQFATGDILKITASAEKESGTTGSPEFGIWINGHRLWGTDGCIAEPTAAGTDIVGWVEILFGSGNNATIYGTCIGGAQDATPIGAELKAGSHATTTFKFSSESWPLDFVGKVASGDVIGLDGFSIIKY